MVSCALSARRQVLRRPKVCRTSPNPGRCEDPWDPPACPPLQLTGYFKFAGLESCHGADHHHDFVASRYGDDEDPWRYRTAGYPDVPGSHCHFSLWQTPSPEFQVIAAFVEAPGEWCAIATSHSVPIDWCFHQAHVIGDWDTISDDLSCHLEVSW